MSKKLLYLMTIIIAPSLFAMETSRTSFVKEERINPADLQDKYGMTPLMQASWNNNLDQINLLINLGADLDIKTHTGKTALMLAAANCRKDAVKLLIDAGARVNIADEKGKTAFDIAQMKGDKDIVNLLKTRGAKSGAASRSWRIW